MGMFSWVTSDTGESISNVHSERGAKPVWMLAPDGRKWYEPAYEGYGIFGGKDYYELLAELNGKSGRLAGIELDYTPSERKLELVGEGTEGLVGYVGVVRPRLVASAAVRYENVPDSPTCEFQGFFYY